MPALTGAVLAGSPACPALAAPARFSWRRCGLQAGSLVLAVPARASGPCGGRALGLSPPPASLSWPPSAFEAVCFRWAVLLRRRGWVPARCRLRQLGTRPPCGGRPDAQNSPAAGPGPTPRPLGWCRLVAWPLGVPARLASGQPGKRSRSPPQSGCAGQLPRQGGAMMARPGSGGGKPGGRPKAAPTRALFCFRRGGLRPPAVPTQHHAVCGARRPRRAKPRRDPYRLPNLKSPFFFRCQKPSLFLEGKKKRVLKASFSSLRPKKLPQSPSVTAPSKREPKTGDADSSLRSE